MKNRNGQALVEYLLIIVVVSVIFLGIVKLLGGYVRDAVTKSTCELVGKTYVEGDSPGQATCEE